MWTQAGIPCALTLASRTSYAVSACRNEIELRLWKDADPGIPILKQAKAEYAKLR